MATKPGISEKKDKLQTRATDYSHEETSLEFKELVRLETNT